MSLVEIIEYLQDKRAFKKKVKYLTRNAEEALTIGFYKTYTLTQKDGRWALGSLEQKASLYSLDRNTVKKTFNEPKYFLMEYDGTFFIFTAFKSISGTNSYIKNEFVKSNDRVIKRFQELFQTYGKQELSKSCESPSWEQSTKIMPQRLESLFLMATFDCEKPSDVLIINKRVDLDKVKSKIKKIKLNTQCKFGNFYE